MIALGVKALIAAVGIGTVALVASSASADTTKPKDPLLPLPKNPDPTATIPPALVTEINQSLLSADPALMRATAKKVAAAGFPEQAATLNAAANAVDAGIAAAAALAALAKPPATQSPGQPTGVPAALPQPNLPFPLPASPPGATPQTVFIPPNVTTPILQLPELVIPGNAVGAQLPTTTDAQRLAGRCALDLATAPVGKEDKTLVAAYQTQERARGFYVGNIDGLYGPASANAFIRDQRIVPPTPRRWPKKNMAGAKAEYKKILLAMAVQDTSRAEEWTTAARKVV